MSFKTFFQGIGEDVATGWKNFLNWFGSEQAEVVAEGKTIIDELVPVVKADLLGDGSKLLATVGVALAAGTDPLIAITAAAEALIPVALSQGIIISKQAAAVAGSFLVAKAQALAAAASSATGAPSGTASAGTTV